MVNHQAVDGEPAGTCLLPRSCRHVQSSSNPASRGQSYSMLAEHLRSTAGASGRCSSLRSFAPTPMHLQNHSCCRWLMAEERDAQQIIELVTLKQSVAKLPTGTVEWSSATGPWPWMKPCSWWEITWGWSVVQATPFFFTLSPSLSYS